MVGRIGFRERVQNAINNQTYPFLKNKNEVKDGEIDQFYSVTKKVLGKSPVYAISQIGMAQNPLRKMIWLLILILGFLASFHEAYRFLKCFLKYPVVVNLHLEKERNLDFPAVTVCNLNRMKSIYQRCLVPNISLESCLHPGLTMTRTTLFMSERRGLQSCTTQLGGKIDKENEANFQFFMKYSSLSEDIRKEIGSRGKEFIKHCSFNGKLCSENDFLESQSLRYGNCFTFNQASLNVTKPLTVSETEYWSGLELNLELNYDDYLPLSSTVGARVNIHDPNVPPSPEEYGIDISSGFETSVAITQTQEIRLPSPYRDHCVNYSDEGPYRHSQGLCVRYCIQKINYKTCGCADPTLTSTTRLKTCNLTNANESCCLNEVLDRIFEDKAACDCPLPCVTTFYGEKVSVAKWPSEASFFKGNLTKSDYLRDVKHLRKSQAKLRVFYSTLIRKIYRQRKRFLESEIFSHIGGELGLWLGLTLMVIFEIFETSWYLIKYFINLHANHNGKLQCNQLYN
ncbi:Degenerin mec-10 [Araneus ventricosus]|uniref:Degenerin mec-10 n=1 Tax=Araneus ventricosus TaxID=182803 RepID=A0A4Y2CR52_ARAVE|nr:Degenerin mec-10 [Araneus ventricosus]